MFKRLDLEYAIEKSFNIHGKFVNHEGIEKNNFDVLGIEFIGGRTFIRAKCNRCQEIFLQHNGHYFRKQKCKCRSYLSLDEVQKKSSKIHGTIFKNGKEIDRYTILNIKLKLNEKINKRKSWITIQCNTCKLIFERWANNHMRCGCPECNFSKGEMEISRIFKQYDIEYNTQQTFSDLLSDSGSRLRCDFYLPKLNLLIEYDGKQHFDRTIYDFLNIKMSFSFEEQQKRDRIKNAYAKSRGIPLIRIRYDQDIIEELLKNDKIKEIVESFGMPK